MLNRFFLTVLFLSSVSFAGTLYGSPDSTETLSQRVRWSLWSPQMQPPYTFFDTVNISAVADSIWTVPDTVKICEVRFLKPGTYNIRLTRSGYRPYVADTSDILRIDLRNFRRTGTDSLCRFGSIRVFGFVE